jgi:hypothetical protein
MRFRKHVALIALLVFSSVAFSAISVDRLKTDIAWLSDTDRGGRRAGTPGAAASAEYIASAFRDIGFNVQMQEFTNNRRNVVARFGDSDRYILLGAHYDGQGPGFPSASDNAAGIAVLLELARELKDTKLPVSIVEIAFDDEEQGLNGSRYYTDHSPFPLQNAIAAIIFDTLGRSFMDLNSWTLFVLGTEYSKELSAVVDKHKGPELLVAGTDLIGPRSDFAPFAVKRVPYLFFSNATHKDYHGPGDTPDQINYTKLAQYATLIANVTEDLARLPSKPAYLADPIYPASERETLLTHLAQLETERKDLPEAYRLMLADLKSRVKTDSSRDLPRIAATALLAAATPRLSSFMLMFILGPFYESEGKRDIAAAIYEEALKWAEASERQELQAKIRALRNQ